MTILKKRHNKELEHNSPGSQGNQEQNCIVKAHTGYLKVELFFEGCQWFMIWSIILQTQLVRLLGLSVIRLGQSFLGFRIGTTFCLSLAMGRAVCPNVVIHSQWEFLGGRLRVEIFGYVQYGGQVMYCNRDLTLLEVCPY